MDASYRVLTLQNPTGRKEVVKVALDTKVLEMAPGDAVVVKALEAKAVRIKKP